MRIDNLIFVLHIPVLLNEVLEYLNPRPNQNFVDCTINGGGHGLEILGKIKPGGKLLGIDWDKETIKGLDDSDKRIEAGENLILVCGNYSNLKDIIEENNFYPVNGILFDLGMSSWDLEESGRGFSFSKDEPLDMRYSQAQETTARKIINHWPEEELKRIFFEFGEERRARAIAKKICLARKNKAIERTTDLVEIIKITIPARYASQSVAGGPARFRFGRIHFATRVFQALRIAVNKELDNLRQGLEGALDVLAPDGRIVVISFHSLEDRIAKNFFKDKAKEGRLQILTKKPIGPSFEEKEANPRARSAKLRAIIKLR